MVETEIFLLVSRIFSVYLSVRNAKKKKNITVIRFDHRCSRMSRPPRSSEEEGLPEAVAKVPNNRKVM